VSLVPNVFYSCYILHNLTIKCGTIDVEEFMQRMALEAEEEIRRRNVGEWRPTKEDELQYNNRLEEGENAGLEARNDVVYYLAVVQPHRA
jgi:hypothetical protein